MRKGIGFVMLSLLAVFVSCKDTGPATYKTLVGAWHCTENSIYGSRSYLIDVYRTKADTTVYLLSNFHNITTDDTGDVRAKLKGSTLTIEVQQTITSGSTSLTVISGTGTVAADLKQIDLDYKVFDGKTNNNVHALYSRP